MVARFTHHGRGHRAETVPVLAPRISGRYRRWTTDTIGPVDFAIVEFPRARVTGAPVAELLTLVDNGVIRNRDLVFIAKTADGTVRTMEITDLHGDGELDLQILSGASSGLIDGEDQVEAGSALEPGSAAAVLLFENPGGSHSCRPCGAPARNWWRLGGFRPTRCGRPWKLQTLLNRPGSDHLGVDATRRTVCRVCFEVLHAPR